MTKIRLMLASLLAIFMLAFMAVPANAVTAYNADWSCLSYCWKHTYSNQGAMQLQVALGAGSSQARTTKFAGLNQNVQLCVTYATPAGNWAGVQLWNSSGLNVSFQPRGSTFAQVCTYTHLSGTNVNAAAFGSTGSVVEIHAVTVNP